MVHYGHADTVCGYRAAVLAAAYAAHPERFVRQPPKPPALPTAVWINPAISRRQPAVTSRSTTLNAARWCLTIVDNFR
jgi:hypothetical protein